MYKKILAKHGILSEEISRQIQDAVGKLLRDNVRPSRDLKPYQPIRQTKATKALAVLLEPRDDGQGVSQQEFLRKLYGTDKLTTRNLCKLRVLIFRVRRNIEGAGVIVFEGDGKYKLYVTDGTKSE